MKPGNRDLRDQIRKRKGTRRCPAIDEELIEWLRIELPDPAPLPEQSHAEVMYHAGMHRVVEILDNQRRKQESNGVHRI